MLVAPFPQFAHSLYHGEPLLSNSEGKMRRLMMMGEAHTHTYIAHLFLSLSTLQLLLLIVGNSRTLDSCQQC